MDSELLVYSAASIDYEGTVSVHKFNSREPPSYGVFVQVINMEFQLIKFLYENFGGNITPRITKNDNHSNGYVWYIGSKNAIYFLESISPFIKSDIKRELIEIVIELQSKLKAGKKRAKYVVDEQESLYQRAKELNIRGNKNIDIDKLKSNIESVVEVLSS